MPSSRQISTPHGAANSTTLPTVGRIVIAGQIVAFGATHMVAVFGTPPQQSEKSEAEEVIRLIAASTALTQILSSPDPSLFV